MYENLNNIVSELDKKFNITEPIYKGESFVLHVKSDDCLKKLVSILKENGYTVKILNPKDPQSSDRYNPFCYIYEPQDVTSLVDVIINYNQLIYSSDETDSEYTQHYRQTEKALLTALIYYMICNLPGEIRTFESVRDLINIGTTDITVLDDLFKKLNSSTSTNDKFKDEAILSYKQFRRLYDDLSHGYGLWVSLIARLLWFNTSQGRIICSCDSFDINTIRTKKTAIICITDPDNRELNILAPILWAQVRAIAANDALEGDIPVQIFVDQSMFTDTCCNRRRK